MNLAVRYNKTMTDDSLTHLDAHGRAKMVDVGGKDITERWAVAAGEVLLNLKTVQAITQGTVRKGNVLTVAQIAGIQAAKRTWELIPLCHPLALTQVDVNLEIDDNLPGIRITATTRCIGQTGVELEALTAVATAALCVYDMVKAIDRDAVIGNIHLVEKHGGKSGDYVRNAG